MAHLRDIKVGQKVEIVKGKKEGRSFNLWNADDFVGSKITVVEIKTYSSGSYIKTDLKYGAEFPPDWIKIIKDEKEQPVKTEKTTKDVKPKYAVLDVADDSGISDYFEDISQVFEVMSKWQGYEQGESVEFFEKGYYKIIEVKELDVKIEVPKPVIKIVG